MRILMVSLTILLVSAAMACGTGATEKAEQPADRPETGSAGGTGAGPEAGQGGLVENPGAIPSGALGEFSTDFTRSAITFETILSGGPPKDGIPSIDSPKFISLEAADRWIGPQEAVLVLRYKGRVRVYPLQILMWHEIVNDEIDGTSVIVTYCPLCNTGVAFKGEIDGQSMDFGTTGRLRYSNLIMYDRQSETWWQQASGRGLIGEYAGRSLPLLPISILPWNEVLRTYGGTESGLEDGASGGLGTFYTSENTKENSPVEVLSKQTGQSRPYGNNPYQGYDTNSSAFLYAGPETPDEYETMERVLAVQVEDEERAFPFEQLSSNKVTETSIGGRRVVVFWQPGTASALDAGRLAEGRDVGSAQAYYPVLEDRETGDRTSLTFQWDGEAIRDEETGSRWSVSGRAIDGPLAGAQLESPVSINHFWFSWNAFQK